jgi:hypothetical protein
MFTNYYSYVSYAEPSYATLFDYQPIMIPRIFPKKIYPLHTPYYKHVCEKNYKMFKCPECEFFFCNCHLRIPDLARNCSLKFYNYFPKIPMMHRHLTMQIQRWLMITCPSCKIKEIQKEIIIRNKPLNKIKRFIGKYFYFMK